jgi:GTP pyrophosphokinase
MTHSRNRIDRAGQTLADHLRLIAVDAEGAADPPPTDVLQALEIVEWWRGEHSRPLSRVAANLRYYASEHGTPTVAQRLKKLPTIAHKLLREPRMKLSRMADIGGVRAVLPNQRAAYKVASRLRRNWTITRFRDYAAAPKPDGYRALHLINRNRGRLIEVQLRTPHQDLWANAVEADARRFDLDLKSGGGPPELFDFYVAVGKLFADLDQGKQPDNDLLDLVQGLRRRADTFRQRSP